MRQLIDLHYKNKLGHMSSTLTAYPIIKKIYEEMGEDDVFILSQGHAGLALYVVLGRGQELLEKHGIHPNRSIEDGIFCTTGSLGQGITVAVGMAMAGRTVHVLISDGECAEGAVWEAINFIMTMGLRINIHVNWNSLSAMGMTNHMMIDTLMTAYPGLQIHIANKFKPPFTNTIKDHYFSLTEEQYREAIKNFDC